MLRFLADASLHHAIVIGCLGREPTIDFRSANQARLEGLSDPEVLSVAARENRILVTSDVRTLRRHFGQMIAAGGSSPGVFLVKQRTPLADVIDAILLAWAASDSGDWANRIVEISP